MTRKQRINHKHYQARRKGYMRLEIGPSSPMRQVTVGPIPMFESFTFAHMVTVAPRRPLKGRRA